MAPGDREDERGALRPERDCGAGGSRTEVGLRQRHVGPWTEPVPEDGPVDPVQRPAGARVVHTCDDRLAALGERREGCLDLRAAVVVIEVILLDVGDHPDLRAEEEERRVALVGLRHEDVAAAVQGS